MNIKKAYYIIVALLTGYVGFAQIIKSIAIYQNLISNKVSFILITFLILFYLSAYLYVKSGKIKWGKMPMKKIGVLPNMIFLGILCGLISTINFRNKIVEINQFNFDDTGSFNILILPFTPDAKCKFITTNYENQVIERLNTLAINNNLNIETYFFQIDSCILTWKDAHNLKERTNSDMIIWGSYEEKCDTEDKIRIRFVSNDYVNDSLILEGDTEMQALQNLNKLRQGEMTKDLEKIAILTLSFAKTNNEEIVEMLFENFNSCTDGYSKIGEIYMKENKYSKAKEFYNDLINCNDNRLTQKALFNIGICHYWQDSLLEATALFKEYIKYDSLSSLGFNAMARVLHSQEKYNKAIFFYLKTIDLINQRQLENKVPIMPSAILPDSFIRLAHCFSMIDSFDKEHQYLKFGTTIWPNNINLNYNLARSYERKDSLEAANYYYSQVSKLDSTIVEEK